MYNTTTRYIFPLYSSEIGPNDVDDATLGALNTVTALGTLHAGSSA